MLGSGVCSAPFDAELLGVLRVQSLPAAELHGLEADDAAYGRSAEQVIQHVQADVPSGRAHRNVAAIDVGPQREARAAVSGFELPPHIESAPGVLEQLWSVGSRDRCVGYERRG